VRQERHSQVVRTQYDQAVAGRRCIHWDGEWREARGSERREMEREGALRTKKRREERGRRGCERLLAGLELDEGKALLDIDLHLGDGGPGERVEFVLEHGRVEEVFQSFL